VPGSDANRDAPATRYESVTAEAAPLARTCNPCRMSQRRAAMLLIVTDDGKLLLHHRDNKPGISHPGCWAGFGGAVEEGESVERPFDERSWKRPD
jgi:NUDIX domain